MTCGDDCCNDTYWLKNEISDQDIGISNHTFPSVSVSLDQAIERSHEKPITSLEVAKKVIVFFFLN